MKNLIKHIQLATLGLILLGSAAVAQSSFIPHNLGSNVNSAYPEINPIISLDGKTIYFTRVNHPDNTVGKIKSQDVWFCSLN